MPTFVVTLTNFVHAHGDGTTGILSTPPEPPWIEIDGKNPICINFCGTTSIENHDVKVFLKKNQDFATWCIWMYLEEPGSKF